MHKKWKILQNVLFETLSPSIVIFVTKNEQIPNIHLWSILI